MRELILIEHQWQCFSFQHFKIQGNGVWERTFPELTDDEKLNNRDLQGQCNFRNVKAADKISSFIIYPIKTTNVIDSAEKDLEKMYNVQPLSWTSFHLEKGRYKSEDHTTIDTPLPLINHNSNIVDLQLHLIVTSVEYTEYLNICVYPTSHSIP